MGVGSCKILVEKCLRQFLPQSSVGAHGTAWDAVGSRNGTLLGKNGFEGVLKGGEYLDMWLKNKLSTNKTVLFSAV